MDNRVIVDRTDADTFDVWPAAMEHGTTARGRVERRGQSRSLGKARSESTRSQAWSRRSRAAAIASHAVIERMLGQ